MTRLPRRATTVWLALVAVTALSWFVGGGHPLAARVGLALVVVLAFAKAAAVGWEFMELGRAAAAERRLFVAWIVVVGATCAVLAAT